jgi:hypothetical protein
MKEDDTENDRLTVHVVSTLRIAHPNLIFTLLFCGQALLNTVLMHLQVSNNEELKERFWVRLMKVKTEPARPLEACVQVRNAKS